MLKKTFLLFIVILIGLPEFSAAQVDSEFALASRLMQQQRYGEALPLLEEVVKRHPQNYTYVDRLIECYIQLKRYDDGIDQAARIANNYDQYEPQANIRLGELYHFKDDTSKAFSVWMNNLQQHSNQLQLYINTGRTMVERREYEKAIEVYKKARNTFQNDRLFFGDIAEAYMRAGNYESAINEWLKLLEEAPNQLGYIKRNLLRYDDPILYDITIIELDERLSEIPITEKIYSTFYELQVWLLLENGLYRRALVTAREYESKSSSFTFSLFNLGEQLTDNKEFELAEQAFNYYIDKASGEVKWRSMEELSNTYSTWAKYLDDYNLDFTNKRDSLYRQSYSRLEQIEAETKNYSRMGNVYLKQAELSLDFVFDLEAAQQAITKLKSISQMRNSPEVSYLEGRIHLAKKEFPEARIDFTTANKAANVGELAEKTRYFLALTDFYAGDYEFSKIQLKSLGRQNTSYYANDALELRLWLQEGLAVDTTGSELDDFAEAVFKNNNGSPEESTRQFLSIISGDGFKTLKDDALLFFVNSRHAADTTKLNYLTQYMNANRSTPIKEKLLWEQARLTEKTGVTVKAECTTAENCFFAKSSDGTGKTAKDFYEELILSFPQGFYAPYARERLTELTRENS